MATSDLDLTTLLRSHPWELVNYFKRLIVGRENSSEISTLSSQLFELIRTEAVPPHVYVAWIQLVSPLHPSVVVDALTCKESASIRKQAIKTFRKLLGSERWREVWEAAGGVSGVITISSTMSVDNIALFLLAIAKAFEGPRLRCREGETEIEELLEGLLPSVFGESKHIMLDDRPFTQLYCSLLPSCGKQFVRKFLASPTAYSMRQLLPLKRLGVVHRVLYQEELLVGAEKWPYNEAWNSVISPHDANSPSSFPGQLAKREPEKIDAMLRRLMSPSFAKQHREEELRPLMELGVQLIQQGNAHSAKDNPGVSSTFMRVAIVYWTKVLRIDNPRTELRVLAEQCLDAAAATFRDNSLLQELKNLVSGRGKAQNYFQTAPRHLRYPLLKRLFLLCKPNPIDLDDTNTLGKEPASTNLQFTATILLQLRRPEAAELCTTLYDNNSNFQAAESSAHIWRQSAPIHSAEMIDATSGHLYHYLRRQGTAQTTAEALIDLPAYKDKALKSRDQPVRAFWVCAALRRSVASSSLQSYYDTVLWSQRYLRDPLTLAEMYSGTNSVINTPELVSLLSDLPEHTHGCMLPDEVAHHIHIANEVIRKHFSYATQSLQEPSFNPRDWLDLATLPGKIVLTRLNTLLRRASEPVFEALADAVLPQTLDMILELERLCLDSGHVKLGIRNPRGLVKFYDESCLTRQLLPTKICQFLDSMASRRDGLWREVRARDNPDVLSLETVWPRGLAIQHLLPGFVSESTETERRMPYFTNRLHEVYNITPDEAFTREPTVEPHLPINLAVGHHVNDFSYALLCYVAKARGRKDEVRRKLSEVFDRCKELILPEFSVPRQELAWHKILRDIFMRDACLLPPILDNIYESEPALPVIELNDPEAVVEWTPFRPLVPKNDETRAIDIMLSYRGRSQRERSIRDSDVLNKLRGSWQGGGYNMMRYMELATPSQREAIILCAILIIDTKSGSATRLLQQPWPAPNMIRFPAVFLDDEFLSKVNENDAFQILTAQSKYVPTALLERLLSRLLIKFEDRGLESSQINKFQGLVFRVCLLLTNSERPSTAVPLIVKTVLYNTRASSWHRQLLSVALCKRLMAAEAAALIESIMTGLIGQSEAQKMKSDQNQLDLGAVGGPAQAQPDSGSVVAEEYDLPEANTATAQEAVEPMLKITTGKMITTLLSQGGFLQSETALDYLTKILRLSTHIDLITTTVQSLLTLLTNESRNADKIDRIFTALQALIPRISGPNEREITTLEYWQRSEAGGPLPEVTLEGQAESQAPIAHLLFGLTLEADFKEKYVDQVLLPALDAAIAAHERWITIYLTREAPGVTIPIELKRRPFRKQMLATLLNQYLKYLPKRILDLERNLALTPVVLYDFKHVVAEAKEGRKARSGPDVNAHQRWLEITRATSSGATLNPLPTDKVAPPQSAVGIELRDLLHMRRAVFRRFLHDRRADGKTYVARLSGALTGPWSIQPPSSKDFPEWHVKVRPCLEECTEDISDLRTPAWQKDLNRWPERLPDTYSLQLQLKLPWTTIPKVHDSPDRFSSFASTVVEELKNFLAHDKPYADKFEQLKRVVLLLPSRDYTAVALELWKEVGSMDGTSTEQLLCLDICSALLQKVSVQDASSEAVGKVKDMLRAWQTSSAEELRTLAFTTEDVLSARKWPMERE